MNFGTRNELHHHNKRIRNDRMNEIAGRVVLVVVFAYLIIQLWEQLA